MNMLVVLLIVLAVCAVIGVATRLPSCPSSRCRLSFLLTCANLVYGLCLVYTGAKPIGGLKRNYTLLSTSGMFENRLPYIILIALLVGIFMWFLYNKTRHGKYMYAIGGNETAASCRRKLQQDKNNHIYTGCRAL